MNPPEPTPPPSPWALAALLAGNVLPLVGVLFWGWQVSELLMLYWIENGVIGLYTVLKMLASRGMRGFGGFAAKTFTVPFFCFHYGVFWAAHGLFILSAFPVRTAEVGKGVARVTFNAFNFREGLIPLVQDLLAGPLAPAVVALLVSHGVSFVANYLVRGEFRTLTPFGIMFQPYARVMILHVVILVGSMLVMLLGQPIFSLLLLVVLKTAVDAGAHLREHLRAFLEARAQVTQRPAAGG